MTLTLVHDDPTAGWHPSMGPERPFGYDWVAGASRKRPPTVANPDLTGADMTESNGKPVSRRLRFEILRRDAYTCRYCGGQAPDVTLTVDHVIPVALGGQAVPENLVTACRSCNAGKTSSSPDEHHVADVAEDALRWGRAMAVAAAQHRAAIKDLEARLDIFDRMWSAWHTHNGDGDELPRDPSWRTSVERFFLSDLDLEDLERLIRVAMTAKVLPEGTWRYFCGCCWHTITDRQEVARELIDTGEV